jgi:integrase
LVPKAVPTNGWYPRGTHTRSRGYDARMVGLSPTASLVVRAHRREPFYEAKFRYEGRQVKRRLGPAWLTRGTGDGTWQQRRGRVADGYLDERRAHVAAAEAVDRFVTEQINAEEIARERRERGVTFREVALAYLEWLQTVKGAKPSTLRSHRSLLAEPGIPHRRGKGSTAGHIMGALGDRPAGEVTTREVEQLLAAVASTGVAPRTVNATREIVGAAFNFGMKSTTFSLPANPVRDTDKRRLPAPRPLAFYAPEEVEAIARALADGEHRPEGVERDELARFEDHRDAEAVRIAAFCGLRLGELMALRWRDVDWAGSALTISRSISAGVEGATKTDQVRRVPLADQPAAALDRLSRREDFVSPSDYVFANAYGRAIDPSALRRRYKSARDAAGLRPLRWHDLRHTFGSLLVASGIDLVSVKDAMGHAQLGTTSRYLHARPARDRAAAFTSAFGSTASPAGTAQPGARVRA